MNCSKWNCFERLYEQAKEERDDQREWRDLMKKRLVPVGAPEEWIDKHLDPEDRERLAWQEGLVAGLEWIVTLLEGYK